MALLRTTLESTADGILVVSLQGTVVSSNRKFRPMWQIPDELMESKDDVRLLNYVQDQLADPEAFLQKVRELMNLPEAESHDEWLLKDGRVFERYSQPHRVGWEIVAGVELSGRDRPEAG